MNNLLSYKIKKVIGFAIMIFASVITIAGFSLCVKEFTPMNIGMTLLFAGITFGGFMMVRIANDNLRLDKEWNEYRSILSCGTRDFGEIAKLTGKSEEYVKDRVSKLIKHGYLDNAYSDPQKNAVVVKGDMEIQYVNVVCSACGATSKIVSGNTGICEYCGTAIRG